MPSEISRGDEMNNYEIIALALVLKLPAPIVQDGLKTPSPKWLLSLCIEK